MSNVSIYEKNWIDLVFEDKNKVYGAYQLRQENPRTTLIAFISGTFLILMLLGLWLLLSSFGDKAVAPAITDDPVIVITDIHYPKKEPKKVEAIAPLKKEPATAKKIDKKDLQNAILVKENPDDVRTNKEMKENPIIDNSSNTTTTTGTTATVTSTTTTTGTIIPTDAKKPEIVTAVELDRLPEYPGGMKKFGEDVRDNFERPDVDENLGSVNVIMSFIIEKDGTMSNIKVLRSSDKNLEREAIRVLRSLKAKWSPGYKDGEKMRTLYTLPIRVAL